MTSIFIEALNVARATNENSMDIRVVTSIKIGHEDLVDALTSKEASAKAMTEVAKEFAEEFLRVMAAHRVKYANF